MSDTTFNRVPFVPIEIQNIETKAELRTEIAKQTAEFLASGNKVQQIAVGESAVMDRIFPNMKKIFRQYKQPNHTDEVTASKREDK